MLKDHFNHEFDGGSPDIPNGVGDRFYSQDLSRDFHYLLEKSGLSVKDIASSFPLIISGLIPTKGTGNTLNITTGIGYAELDIDTTVTPWTLPPTVTTATMEAIRVDADAETNLALPSAVLDNVTVNYIKLRYKNDDGDTRTRAKKAGSYSYIQESSHEYIVDDVAPTDYDICLGSFVSVGAAVPAIISTDFRDFGYQPPGIWEEISSDQVLEIKRYRASGALSLTLPDPAVEGNPIEIYNDDPCRIIQAQSENGLSYMHKFYTTKGTTGYLQLPPKSNIKLKYKGSSISRIEPGLKLADPASLPAGTGIACSVSYDGVYLAVAHATSPYITIYKRSGDTFTKLADPASLPAGDGRGVAFSYDGVYLAVAHSTSPYITIYKRSGDTFTKLADPASLPAGTSNGSAFSYDGVYLAVVHGTSPYITIYKRSGDTFTKLADPASLPAGVSYGSTFSYDGVYLAVAHNTSPYITIYKRSGDTFTKLADPASLPAGTGFGASFSYDGVYLAIAHDATPYITIYKRSGDTFTKLADPASLPAGTGRACSFSYDGVYLAVVHGTSPYITIYKRSGDTFTKLADPASLPAGFSYGSTFSYDGVYLAVTHTTSPYITIYKNVEDITKGWAVEKINTLYQDQDMEYLFK